MKRFSRHALFFVGLVGLAVSTVHAASANFNPAIVGADARWVVHADFNALRTSHIGKELVAALEQAQMRESGGLIGVNIPRLLSTVGAVTAYGSNLTPDPALIDGTLIAQGSADLRKIAESILLQGTLAEPKVFGEITDLPFAAYSISEPKRDEQARQHLIIAFPPEGIVLVSKSREKLLKAHAVFRGNAPSLARGGDSGLNKLTTNAAGAYLFAASVVPTEPIFPEKAPQTRMLQLAKSGSVALGQRDEDVFAHVDLYASSDRNAEKLAKILEGMTSMLSLAESNDRHLAAFLNATSVTRENDLVTLRLSYPATRLGEMINNLRVQSQPRPAARPPSITVGKVVAEWTADDVQSESDGLAWRTIENVTLKHGAQITLGRSLNGGRNARFDRIEIVPENGGAPLVFRHDFMRQRGSLLQLPFPGVDGTYTAKVAYINDPERKAKFALSVQDPKPKTENPPGRSEAR